MAISSLSADLRCRFGLVRRSAIAPPPSIYFLRSNFIPKFTYTFPILSNVDYKSIINSKLIVNSTSFSVCNLFNYDNHEIQDNVCRMLASSLLLLAIMFMSLLFTQRSAFAASYGRMGSYSSSKGSYSSSKGSSSSSKGSSSSSKSSRPSRSSWSSCPSSCSSPSIRYIDSVDRSHYYYNLRCSGCNCYVGNRKTRKTCTHCDCFKEKENERSSSSSDVDDSSSISDSICDCKCHMPCKCICHSATIPKPVVVIFCIFFVYAVIAEDVLKIVLPEDTNENNVQASGCKIEAADVRRGSVLMLQVGILDKKRELQRKLYRIAESVDTYTISGLNNVKKEVVKALLEHHDSCHFAYLFAKYDDMEKYSRPCFRGLLETELAKFDKEEETFVNVDGVRCKKEPAGNVNSIENEYSVVTLLVLADGEYWIPSVKWHTPHVNKVDVKTALQKIRSIQRSNLESVEVLWTPLTENDSISEQELLRDFGLLMRPVIKKPYSLLSWF